jgi:hypothetical protein
MDTEQARKGHRTSKNDAWRLIPCCAGAGNLKVELQQGAAIGAKLEFTL